MSDLYQTGLIATLHRLGKLNLEKVEAELLWYSQDRPIALVLPSLITELEGAALKKIISELQQVKYIKEIIITLGPCSRDEFLFAKDFFSDLPQKKTLIWNSGKRMQNLYESIEASGLPLGEEGKGKSAWMAYGYVLSRKDFRVITLHDCDITTYNRTLLARLCYPVANPNLDYEFCKGFYSRVTDRMHGRVTRLLVIPLVRSLIKIVGHLPMLDYLNSFRYPLAGEFAMSTEMARVIRIPGDWGLEVGVLAEVYRNSALKRICQVEITENYEHKHQELSPDDASKGLMKMGIDICKSIFRTLASEGVVFTAGFFQTLVATYVKIAQDHLKRYEDDSSINSLVFDRHAESLAVESFKEGIKMAAEIITEDPLGVPLIPGWDRVASAIPDIFGHLKEAVEEDNNE